MSLATIKVPAKIASLTKGQTLELQTLLANLGLYPANQIDGIYGPNTAKAWQQFKQTQHLNEPELIGPSSLQTLQKAGQQNQPLITRHHFDLVFHHARLTDRDIYYLPLNQSLKEFQINTLPRIAAFLAQLMHESGSLRYSQEIASGAAYEGRRDLGNLHPGDGKRYKGRGLIQLTGRANYRQVGTSLNLPLEANPLLALDPTNSARIAGYFWHSRGLNPLADQNTLESFKAITRRINGGYNGLQDRLIHWNHTKRVLGI